MIKRIMVVDDEKQTGIIIKNIFERDGFVVNNETDPETALEKIRKYRPSCVLLDVRMPKMNGIEVLSKIRKFSENLGVIMITAHGSLENAIESRKMGAYDYILKPFELGSIRRIVRGYFEHAFT